MDTKEIMELLSDPKQSEEVITAAVVYCKEGEQQYKDELAAKDEKIEAMQAELDALKKKSKDDFISELVHAGKLAPKNEEAERMWRDCFEANLTTRAISPPWYKATMEARLLRGQD